MLPEDLQRRLAALDAGAARGADPPPPRRAAVAAILRACGDDADVLLMQRVQHERDPWSGQVSLPGGMREPHDGDLAATAVRETLEEVGLDLAVHGRLLGRLPAVGAIARGGPVDMDITPFVFRVAGDVELHAGPEVQAVFWLPLRRVVAGELDAEYVWRDGAVSRRLPAWRWEGRTIWGLTHRMLVDLLAVLAGGP